MTASRNSCSIVLLLIINLLLVAYTSGELFAILNTTVLGSAGMDDALSLVLGSDDEIYLAGWTHGEVFENYDVPYGAYGYTGSFLWTRPHPSKVQGSSSSAGKLSSATGRVVGIVPGDYAGRLAISASSSSGNGVLSLALVTTDTSLAPYITSASLTPFQVSSTALSSSSSGASTSSSASSSSNGQDIRRLTSRSLQSNSQQYVQNGLDVAIDSKDGSYWVVGSQRSGSQSSQVAAAPTNNATSWTNATTSSTSSNAVTSLTDVAFWHYSSQGKLLSSFTMGNTTNNEVANRIKIDTSSNLYVIGSTNSKIFNNKRVSGTQDAFLVKINGQTGEQIYTTLIGGAGWDDARAILLDNTNKVVYVAGCTTASATSNDLDVFVSKFSSETGERLYTITFAGDRAADAPTTAPNGNECASDLAFFIDGDLLVTGYTTARSIKGVSTSKASSDVSSNDQTADAFIAKLSSSDGFFGGIQFFGNAGVNDYGNSLVVTTAGDIILAGTTYENDQLFYGIDLSKRPTSGTSLTRGSTVSNVFLFDMTNSLAPSTNPTMRPTQLPTLRMPTKTPSRSPTSSAPVIPPTRVPTMTRRPSYSPTEVPSRRPSKIPTARPTLRPIGRPTPVPTREPTTPPTRRPSRSPTIPPWALRRTKAPTIRPSTRTLLQDEVESENVREVEGKKLMTMKQVEGMRSDHHLTSTAIHTEEMKRHSMSGRTQPHHVMIGEMIIMNDRESETHYQNEMPIKPDEISFNVKEVSRSHEIMREHAHLTQHHANIGEYEATDGKVTRVDAY